MGPTRLRLKRPVSAAIEGYAVAGGLELAAWCDLRVASEHAVLEVFCRRIGVPLVDLGTIRLPRLIGHSRAMDLTLIAGGPLPTQGEVEDVSFLLEGRSLVLSVEVVEVAIVSKQVSGSGRGHRQLD